MQSKEIEVKAHVYNKEKLIQQLLEHGCMLSEPVRQEDEYYINFEGSFTQFRPQENFLRVRTLQDRSYFTLKQPQSNELDVLEHTTEVSDKEELIAILQLLGYRYVISVKKERQEGKLGNYNVCVDSVEGLGDFIELEYIGTDEAVLIQNDQKRILSELGIEEKDVVIHGYDTLMYMHTHKEESK